MKIPKGWPTEEMIEAADAYLLSCCVSDTGKAQSNKYHLPSSFKWEELLEIMLAVAPKPSACPMCNGRGEIGGFVNVESGYQNDPCPECATLPEQHYEEQPDGSIHAIAPADIAPPAQKELTPEEIGQDGYPTVDPGMLPPAQEDECAATGFDHKFGSHGPNGERQCEYCGEAQEAEPVYLVCNDYGGWEFVAKDEFEKEEEDNRHILYTHTPSEKREAEPNDEHLHNFLIPLMYKHLSPKAIEHTTYTSWKDGIDIECVSHGMKTFVKEIIKRYTPPQSNKLRQAAKELVEHFTSVQLPPECTAFVKVENLRAELEKKS
jgi:hypothetical protein